jgi:hypothetical protein
MTSDRPAPRFDFDDDERRFLADAGLPAGEEALFRECPSLPLLLAADEGALPPETHDRVASHLATCAFCRSLVQDVKEAGLGEPTAEEHERVRARIQSQTQQMKAPPPQTGASSWMTTAAGLALAASLVLVAGLAWYARSVQQRAGALEQELTPLRGAATDGQQRIAALEGQLAELRLQMAQPDGQANVPVVDLEPAGARRAAQGDRAFGIPAGARFVTLILQLDGGAADGLTADIRDASGAVRWSMEGLRASSLGVVTVLVPRTGVPDGNAVITLARVRDGRRVTLAEYRARFDRVP